MWHVHSKCHMLFAIQSTTGLQQDQLQVLQAGFYMSQNILQIQNLQFTWPGQKSPTLEIEEFNVGVGETVFLHGPSGCGKSTLLSLMAGVFLPQQGKVVLHGVDWAALSASKRDRYRADQVGYIFQQFNLLPYLSVLDNVLLPCRFSEVRRNAANQRSDSIQEDAKKWLAAMDLPPSAWSGPARALSVGQQQRVAAARALIGTPSLVIADEPTSALDEGRRNAFMDSLMGACAEARSTLVFVSHDQRIASRFARQVSLSTINRAVANRQEVPA